MNEQQIQANCVIAFRNSIGRHGRGIMVEINNNENNVVAGVRRKAMGLITGFPDTMIIVMGRIFFIEFKTANGYQKPAQKKIEQQLTSLGHTYYIARSYDDFVKIIYKETGILL